VADERRPLPDDDDLGSAYLSRRVTEEGAARALDVYLAITAGRPQPSPPPGAPLGGPGAGPGTSTVEGGTAPTPQAPASPTAAAAAPAAAPSPPPPAEASILDAIREQNQRYGVEAPQQYLSRILSSNPISDAFERMFPRDQYKGNLAVDAARGLAVGADVVLKTLGVAPGLATHAAGNAVKTLVGPIVDVLSGGDLPEEKIRLFTDAASAAAEATAGLALPPGALVGPLTTAGKAAQTGAVASTTARAAAAEMAEAAAKRLQTMADDIARLTAEAGSAVISGEGTNLAKAGRGELIVPLYTDVPELSVRVPGKVTPDQAREFLSRPAVQQRLLDPDHAVKARFDPNTGETELAVVGAVSRETGAALAKMFLGKSNLDAAEVDLIVRTIKEHAKRAGVTPREFQRALRAAKQALADPKYGLTPVEQTLVAVVEKLHPELMRNLPNGERGAAHLAVLLVAARVLAGAAAGAAAGDTLEERIRNAAIGAGLGAILDPKLVKGFAKAARDAKLEQRGGPLLGPKRKPAAVVVPKASEAIQFSNLDPDVIDIGDKALKINWSALGDPEAITDTIKKIVALRGEEIDAARRGVITDERLRHLADLLGTTVEDILKRPQGAALNAEQILAVIDLVGANVKKLEFLNTQYQAARANLQAAMEAGAGVEAAAQHAKVAREALQAHLGVTAELLKQFYGARAEAGRATRVFGTAEAQNVTASAGQLANIGELHERGLIANVDRISDYLATLRRPEQKMSFLRQVAKQAVPIFFESWFNSLLLTFQGNAANLLGNVTTTTLAPFERLVAGGYAALRGADPADRVFMGEGAATIIGATMAVREALHAAVTVAKTGKPGFGMRTTKEIPVRALSSEALHLTGAPGRAVDFLGTLVTSASRGLMTVDEFFKVTNYHMELWAQAYREARRQGLTGAPMREFLRHYLVDPPPHVKQLAEAFANYQTFTKPLTGRLASMEHAMSHPLVRLIVPFFRTPVNVFTFGFERFPILGAAVKAERDDLLAGGARRDLAIAKQVTGAFLLGFGVLLAMDGRITGRGPSDPKLRATWLETHLPYAAEIGKRLFSFDRWDLFGLYFGGVADFVAVASELSADSLIEYAVALRTAISRGILSKVYLEGLDRGLSAVMENDPHRLRADFFQRLGASLVGGIPIVGQILASPGLAQIEKQVDPIVRETWSVLDEIISRVPGYSTVLPPRRNLFGDPVMASPGFPGPLSFLSPIRVKDVRDDPQAKILNELIANRVAVGPPAKAIYGAPPPLVGDARPRSGIPLTMEQYDRYAYLSGKIEIAGRNLEAALRAFLDPATPEGRAYANAQPGPDGRGRLLENVILKYREAARAQLLTEYPELYQKLIQQEVDRAAALDRRVLDKPSVQKLVQPRALVPNP
jgi:hypothetical protein